MATDILNRTLKSPEDIPQVEQVLSSEFVSGYIDSFSRPYVTMVVRAVFDMLREKLIDGATIEGDEVRKAILARLEHDSYNFFTSVINATGIVVHTNLGRSSIGRERANSIAQRLSGYCNLEYDLFVGKRGKRGTNVSRLFALLTGVEAACVVNNNAAAVYLILNTFCNGKECVVSRSELVQIGGGFRMPDVMASSGAKLREIGTTNRVSFDDYYGAVGERTGMIAKIHWSNFKITGFTSTVDASKLADLGKERGVHVMYDLGSGSWVAPEEYGAKEEPSIRSAVSSGVDSVCFSGDKLLGGPQSGVILGSTETIEQLNQNPLYRAFRPNKVTLLLLEDLLLIYLRGDAVKMVPTLGFLTAQTRLLEMRADRICEELTKAGIQAEVIETEAMVGGGGAPEEPLQSYGVKLTSRLSPDDLSRRLRLGKPPVIGRIIDDAYVLDIKAVFKEEDDLLISSVREALSS